MRSTLGRTLLLEALEVFDAQERENMQLRKELASKLDDLRVQHNLVVRLQKELAQRRENPRDA